MTGLTQIHEDAADRAATLSALAAERAECESRIRSARSEIAHCNAAIAACTKRSADLRLGLVPLVEQRKKLESKHEKLRYHEAELRLVWNMFPVAVVKHFPTAVKMAVGQMGPEEAYPIVVQATAERRDEVEEEIGDVDSKCETYRAYLEMNVEEAVEKRRRIRELGMVVEAGEARIGEIDREVGRITACQ